MNDLTVEEIQEVGESIALYQPLSPKLSKFHQSTKNICWLFGGNQSGKSYSNMMDLALTALEIHPYRSVSNGVHWVGIESWEQVRDVLWAQYLEPFIPKWQIADIRWGTDRVPRKILLKTGHIIEFKAFNQGRTLFQARQVDSFYGDEQCHRDFHGIFNEIQARLIARNGRMSWSMTPVIPNPFLEERIEELPEEDETFFLDLNENRESRGGYITDQRIDQLIADWPEEVHATRIEGRFASYYGAVYKTYNRAVHLIKPFEIPRDWTRYRGIDFGFTNPFVCLWVAKDKDENYYIYREYYKAKTGIQEHIRNIKQLSAKEKYAATYADPENAEDRAELRKVGIPTLTAKKDVARGIEMVQSKLKVKENGKPSLFIFNTCKHTPREFAVYHYPKGTATRDAADVPVSKDDHTLDVIRYIIYSLEKPRTGGYIVRPGSSSKPKRSIFPENRR